MYGSLRSIQMTPFQYELLTVDSYFDNGKLLQ